MVVSNIVNNPNYTYSILISRLAFPDVVDYTSGIRKESAS